MGRMWPPQSVKICLTPASLSVRATRCPPVRSAMLLGGGLNLSRSPVMWYRAGKRSPELLPPDALPVHTLLDQHVPHPVDGLAAAADIDHQPVNAMDQALHQLRDLAPLAAPAGRGRACGREVGKGGVAAGERSELGIVDGPRRVSPPEDQAVEAPVAGLVEVREDRADGHDADLLGHEERAPRVGPAEDEAAGGPLEADRIADLEAAQPLGADAPGRHVDRVRDHALARGGGRPARG